MKKTMYGQASPEPARTCIFLGDSITDGGHLWDGDPRCLGQGYVREIADTLSGLSCRLVNMGQDGFTTADVLRLLRREEQSLAGLLPLPTILSQTGPVNNHCISLLIGINDLSVAIHADPSWIPDRFTVNIHEILSLIRRFHTGRLFVMEPFLFPTPAEHRRWFPLLAEEHKILRDAAGQYGCLYVPLQDRLNRAAAEAGRRRITPDGIHLTVEGSRIVAGEWLKAYSAAFFS